MGDFDSSGSIHGPPAMVMQIIRAAMAMGVAMFAVVTTLVREPRPDPPLQIGYIAAVFAVAMLVPIFFFRSRMETLSTRAKRCTFSIIGWALGESAGMLAVVSYFLGNALVWSLPGLLVLAVAFIAFPPPENEPGM
ncbi:MAG TPA: hypothetical protein VF647_16650 [Longimicrobium sp.]|jgi:hypothetical protein